MTDPGGPLAPGPGLKGEIKQGNQLPALSWWCLSAPQEEKPNLEVIYYFATIYCQDVCHHLKRKEKNTTLIAHQVEDAPEFASTQVMCCLSFSLFLIHCLQQTFSSIKEKLSYKIEAYSAKINLPQMHQSKGKNGLCITPYLLCPLSVLYPALRISTQTKLMFEQENNLMA